MSMSNKNKMEESEKKKALQQILEEDELKEDCGRDLRGMELQAYASVMDALRAEGTLDKDKKNLMDGLRKHFNISEARHIAECRRVNSNYKLLEMANRLQDFDSEAADETWAVESYGVFPPLPPFHRRIGAREPFQYPLPAGEHLPPEEFNNIKRITGGVNQFTTVSDDVIELAKFKWNSKVKKVNKKVQTKVSTLYRNGLEIGSSDESDMGTKNDHERSPDIIDAATPSKNNNKTMPRRGVITKTTRGPRRKSSVEDIKRPTRNETSAVGRPTKIAKKMNFNKGYAKTKTRGKFPKIKFVKRRATTPEISSEDEVVRNTGQDGITRILQSSSTADKPEIIITAPAQPLRGRGGVRGRGISSRGRGRGKVTSTPNMTYIPRNNDLISPSGSTTVSAASVSSPVKRSPAILPSKPLKTSKPKKPKPVSLSRRKSRLKEKEDDDMQVEWGDYDDDVLIMSNKHVPMKRRKLLAEESSHSEMEYDEIGNSRNNHHPKNHYLENGEHVIVRHHHNYLSPNDIHGRGGGDLLQRSPQLSGEETDSASEKGSITGSRTNESPGTNSNASSPPPSRQKQRLKTPLTPTPQLPRINIPPPVFSTSLSSVQKKRPQKQISVVDSLNLHLPTTPTASSLAARRPSMPTGSSIFSNQAILARAGGSPGILQAPRKATPHILSNSKTIQRTYVPTTSSNSGMCVSMGGAGGGTINLSSNNPITSIVSSTGTILSTGVQVQSNIIPSSISSSSCIIQTPSSSNPGGIGTVAGTRTAGNPIILVQKANNNSNVPISSIGLQSNAPPKTGSRAVILRRTTQPHQLPRSVGSQGNVVFVDVQNKSISHQMHPFLQPVSRMMTAPTEMAVLNIQSGQAQRKVIQSLSPDQHQEPAAVIYKPVPASPGSHRKQKLVGNELVFSTLPNNNTGTVRTGQNDVQMAQIEAELLEMEHEIAYEEEVETSDCPQTTNNSIELQNQSIYAIPQNFGTRSTISSTSSDNNSANSSDTNSNVKYINTYGETGENAQNHNSEYPLNMVANHEDIFSTALKSSGIVFTDQQYFDVGEMCETEDGQQHSVDVINHIILDSCQENGSKQ